MSDKKTIKSLVLTEPHKMRLEERPVPMPGPYEVLIRVESAGICHTDFVAINGQMSSCKYPTVPGHEFSGVAESCGTHVSAVKTGDRVTIMSYFYCGVCSECNKGKYIDCKKIKGIPMHADGGYQQMVVVPESAVLAISSSLSFDEAALIEPAANGYAVAERADIGIGETIVIIGPGPIGLLALQAASLKLPGKLVMLGTRKERLALAEKLGATDTVNVRECDPYDAVMDITGGKGADVVLFCGGGQDAWELSTIILRTYGRMVIEALPEPYTAQWPMPVGYLTEKMMSILGVSGYSPTQFRETLSLVERGIIKAAPLITHYFSLDAFGEAFETVLERKDGAVKVIIKPND